MDMFGRVVTVFGGTGFVGSVLVGALAREGARIRVPVGDMEKAAHLRPLGDLGQVAPLLCDVNNPDSVRRLVDGSDTVINLMGILYERGSRTFEKVHVEIAQSIARASREAGVATLIHMSALGVETGSASSYARSKALGEAAVRTAFPKATIIRPSVIFGPGDGFLNRFAVLSRDIPVLAYLNRGKDAGSPRFQPVFVGDVCEAVIRVLCDPALQGKTFELGGDKIVTMKEAVELVVREMRQNIRIVGLSSATMKLIATLVGWLPKPMITQDQVRLLEYDNVLGGTLPGLKELGIKPQSIDIVAAEMMVPYRPVAREVVLRKHA